MPGHSLALRFLSWSAATGSGLAHSRGLICSRLPGGRKGNGDGGKRGDTAGHSQASPCLVMGMGTALEYEIRTEPYVVDLLISLTYSRASTDKLDDLPSGLRLMVPGLPRGEETDYPRAIWEKETMIVRFNRPHPFEVGDWVVLQTEENDEHKAEVWHCRVQSSGAPGILHLSRAVKTQHRTKENTQETPEQSHIKVQVVPYKKNFDELDLNEKRSILLSMLNTLPSVDQMTAFLGAPSTGRALSDERKDISGCTGHTSMDCHFKSILYKVG